MYTHACIIHACIIGSCVQMFFQRPVGSKKAVLKLCFQRHTRLQYPIYCTHSTTYFGRHSAALTNEPHLFISSIIIDRHARSTLTSFDSFAHCVIHLFAVNNQASTCEGHVPCVCLYSRVPSNMLLAQGLSQQRGDTPLDQEAGTPCFRQRLS